YLGEVLKPADAPAELRGQHAHLPRAYTREARRGGPPPRRVSLQGGTRGSEAEGAGRGASPVGGAHEGRPPDRLRSGTGRGQVGRAEHRARHARAQVERDPV